MANATNEFEIKSIDEIVDYFAKELFRGRSSKVSSTTKLKSHLLNRGSTKPLQALIDSTGLSIRVSDFVKNYFTFSKYAYLEKSLPTVVGAIQGCYTPCNRIILCQNKLDVIFHEFAHALDYSIFDHNPVNDYTFSYLSGWDIFSGNFLKFLSYTGFFNVADARLVEIIEYDMRNGRDWKMNKYLRVEIFAQAFNFYFIYKYLNNGGTFNDHSWANIKFDHLFDVVTSPKKEVVGYVAYLEEYLHERILARPHKVSPSKRIMNKDHFYYKKSLEQFKMCFRSFNYDFERFSSKESMACKAV